MGPVVNDLLNRLDGILCNQWSFPEVLVMESKLAVLGCQHFLFQFFAPYGSDFAC